MSYCFKCSKHVDEDPYIDGILFEDDDAFIWHCTSCINCPKTGQSTWPTYEITKDGVRKC